MRHHKQNRKFGRKRNQRFALLQSLAISLIKHGKIETTEAKAKELRLFIEPLVTKAKVGDLHSQRLVTSRLMNNDTEVRKLMKEIAPKYKTVAGGYTRVIKLPTRLVDSAKMAIIEFV
jgi:large subunit ribosomal protein L17